MKSQKIRIESGELEFQRSLLGGEKVFLNSKIVSEKKIAFRSWHIFSLEEKGEQIEYRVKSGLDERSLVSEVFRQGTRLYKEEKPPDKKWVYFLLLGGVIISVIFFFMR